MPLQVGWEEGKSTLRWRESPLLQPLAVLRAHFPRSIFCISIVDIIFYLDRTFTAFHSDKYAV